MSGIHWDCVSRSKASKVWIASVGEEHSLSADIDVVDVHNYCYIGWN